MLALVPLVAAMTAASANDDWPSYNRDLASNRFSPLTDIGKDNVGKLQQVCAYDTGDQTSFQTGPIVVDGKLFATTQFDIFALDPATCKLIWRQHEDYKPASPLLVNRGAAYLDGKLFRGTQDGRVIAYSAQDGKKLWETRIADPAQSETVPAAPIAANGLVYVGNAGGDNFGVKGRMYALDAASGKIVWEFFMVPRGTDRSYLSDGTSPAPPEQNTWKNPPDVPITGGATWTSYTLDSANDVLYVPGGNPAPDFVKSLRPGDNLYTDSIVALDAKTGTYKTHYQLVKNDFHDWDASTAPAIVKTKAGKTIVAIAPKDGYLHAFDIVSGKSLYKTPTTTIKNDTAPVTEKGTHVCPGTQGGSEWNGAAYDADTNLLYVGAVDWCATLKGSPAVVKKGAPGKPWSGEPDEKHEFGELDPQNTWAGWVTAVDADTGTIAWKYRADAPVMSGITPTAGGVVFFGDMEGALKALDAKSGGVLWEHQLDGAAGGGIITYGVNGKQLVAVASGMTSPIWPTPKTTAKIVVFGIP
jgi:alcohol dehydrogenase (cytochrome c)